MLIASWLGGHLKPDPFSRAASVLRTHGTAVAEHVASFEARQVKEIRDLVKHENIDCDFEETRVIDVCMYPEGAAAIGTTLCQLAEADISTAKGIRSFSGSEASEVSAEAFASMPRIDSVNNDHRRCLVCEERSLASHTTQHGCRRIN